MMSDRVTATGVAGSVDLNAPTATGRLLVVLTLPWILPMILVLVLAIRLTSRGPAILRLTRINGQGQTYREYRFRCVWEDARARQFSREMTGKDGGLDPRLTPVGAFLMQSGLNRLPRIFNVLRGDIPLRMQSFE